jgi:hypothetical protein
MIVGLELFVENADSVPELRVSDVLKAVKSLLVGIKGSIDIILKKIAVADGCPARPIFRINLDHLVVVGDGSHVVTLGPIELSHLGVVLESHNGRVVIKV